MRQLGPRTGGLASWGKARRERKAVVFSLLSIVNLLFQVYFWLLIIRVILSWVPVFPQTDFSRNLLNLLHNLTEPYLAIFRRVIPIIGGIDFSPFIAIIILRLIQQAVISLILFGLRI